MKNRWTLGILALTLVVACTDPKQEKVDQLRNEAIDLHDEVMPRMGEMMALTSKLKELREEVATDTMDTTGAAPVVYTEHIVALEAAHEDMMAWMADYKPNYESNHPKDSAVIYYEKERVKIDDVKKAIEKSIEDAEALVEQAKQP